MRREAGAVRFVFCTNAICCVWERFVWDFCVRLESRSRPTVIVAMFEWTYEGVNHSLAGNGGRECLQFISTEQKIAETVIFIVLSMAVLAYSYPRLRMPDKLPPGRYEESQTQRRVVLVVVCVTFGVELGFKFATRQVVWLLNPCHLCTMTQVSYLLKFYK